MTLCESVPGCASWMALVLNVRKRERALFGRGLTPPLFEVKLADGGTTLIHGDRIAEVLDD